MAYWSVSVFVESSDEESVAGAEADHNKAFDCDVTDEKTTPEKETLEGLVFVGLFGYSTYSSRYRSRRSCHE